MSRPTGSITYTVSTSAMPFSTTLGGTCCRPSALRSRLSTTMILVNEVTMTPTNGASATTMTVMSADEGVNCVRSMARLRRQNGVRANQAARGRARGAKESFSIDYYLNDSAWRASYKRQMHFSMTNGYASQLATAASDSTSNPQPAPTGSSE